MIRNRNTRRAAREAEEIGLNIDDISRLLADSYDCTKGKRKKGVEERCVLTDGKILKIVIELRTSRSGLEYWRIRHIGYVR